MHVSQNLYVSVIASDIIYSIFLYASSQTVPPSSGDASEFLDEGDYQGSPTRGAISAFFLDKVPLRGIRGRMFRNIFMAITIF